MLALRFSLPVVAASVVLVPTAAQVVLQRDPQALVVLQESFAAMGGTVPTDLMATGRITIEAGGSTETGTIRLLARGFDQTAEETDIGGSAKNVTFSRGFAKHREREAAKRERASWTRLRTSRARRLIMSAAPRTLRSAP